MAVPEVWAGSKEEGIIVGYRDLNDTACPGKELYKKLGDIRRFAYDGA